MRLSAENIKNIFAKDCLDGDDEFYDEDEEGEFNRSCEQAAKKIKLIALDVDGVLTDGTIYIGNEGEVFKGFNAKDGMGISCALRSGIKVVIITGRKSEIIRRRAEELGITTVLEGVHDKEAALKQLLRQNKLRLEQVAYIGDDLNDLAPMFSCGLSFAPADAALAALDVADFVLLNDGGRGAVREAIELILMSQDKWDDIVQAYSEGGQGDRQ